MCDVLASSAHQPCHGSIFTFLSASWAVLCWTRDGGSSITHHLPLWLNQRSNSIGPNGAQMKLKNLRTFSQLREAPSPRFGSSGDFDWTEAKKMQFAIFRNISDVYTKVTSTKSVTKCNCFKTRAFMSGATKPQGHWQEVPKSKVRKDVEKSEESEDVGGLHPANKSHWARKFGHRASRQSSR